MTVCGSCTSLPSRPPSTKEGGIERLGHGHVEANSDSGDWSGSVLLVVVSVVGLVAGFAAWFEFVGDGVTCLGEGWHMVEFEEVC